MSCADSHTSSHGDEQWVHLSVAPRSVARAATRSVRRVHPARFVCSTARTTSLVSHELSTRDGALSSVLDLPSSVGRSIRSWSFHPFAWHRFLSIRPFLSLPTASIVPLFDTLVLRRTSGLSQRDMALAFAEGYGCGPTKRSDGVRMPSRHRPGGWRGGEG